MPSDPIDGNGLFECRLCGNCCKGYGGTFVTRQDIEAISRYIGTDSRKFVAEYCQLSGQKPVLAQRSDGYCIFWDKLCKIHPVKPPMCKRWPFVKSLLVDSANWQIMADSCPGIQPDVAVHTLEKHVRIILSEE
ncbi:MAG: YkgJ family cysteine cluster protein [Deltaproteobacteria bacterium]|jgi:Fe-S-cluster containining protein|nr:YkgJ family cysteine cluster protein [Deltaproteobacteria bacterium]MBW2480428.1 YkgJ family cysteine cluster protein [Deltaproteobacteria bacterium]